MAEDRNDPAGAGVRATCARLVCLIFALFGLGLVGKTARAQECAQLVGTVQSLEGEVSIGNEATGAWQPAQLGTPLCQTDSVRTGSLSRAALVLVNEEVLRLDQETTLKLADVPLDSAEPTVLDLAFGAPIHTRGERVAAEPEPAGPPPALTAPPAPAHPVSGATSGAGPDQPVGGEVVRLDRFRKK